MESSVIIYEKRGFKLFFSLLGSFHILVFALSGCGEVDRANPSDPVITQGTASFSLLAEFTELQKNDLTDRIIEIQYQIADLNTDYSIGGKMDLIGTTGRVRLNNIETLQKIIKFKLLMREYLDVYWSGTLDLVILMTIGDYQKWNG